MTSFHKTGALRLHVGHAARHDDADHESRHVDGNDRRAQPLIVAHQIPLKADNKQCCASTLRNDVQCLIYMLMRLRKLDGHRVYEGLV